MSLIVWMLLLLSGQAHADQTVFTEKTAKNFTYHMLYSDRTFTLKNGEYGSPLSPGEEDMNSFIEVKLIKYLMTKSFETVYVAVVILAESGGRSGYFLDNSTYCGK
ncbi:hypothetical protein [Thermodesulfovibrio aggregans]|nr:hypothetical protein [Thermodesulfovibrio aggregans]